MQDFFLSWSSDEAISNEKVSLFTWEAVAAFLAEWDFQTFFLSTCMCVVVMLEAFGLISDSSSNVKADLVWKV